MVKYAPYQVDNFILLIFIIVQYSNGVDNADYFFNGFDLKERLFNNHFLKFVDFLKQYFVFIILNDGLHDPKQL